MGLGHSLELCLGLSLLVLDCWETQYSCSNGNKASASRVFISLQDQPLSSGLVESQPNSARVSCGVQSQEQNESQGQKDESTTPEEVNQSLLTQKR